MFSSSVRKSTEFEWGSFLKDTELWCVSVLFCLEGCRFSDMHKVFYRTCGLKDRCPTGLKLEAPAAGWLLARVEQPCPWTLQQTAERLETQLQNKRSPKLSQCTKRGRDNITCTHKTRHFSPRHASAQIPLHGNLFAFVLAHRKKCLKTCSTLIPAMTRQGLAKDRKKDPDSGNSSSP